MVKNELSIENSNKLKKIIMNYGSENIDTASISDTKIKEFWDILISSDTHIRIGNLLQPLKNAFNNLDISSPQEKQKIEKKIFKLWFTQFNLTLDKKKSELKYPTSESEDNNLQLTSLYQDKEKVKVPEKSEEIEAPEFLTEIAENKVEKTDEQPHGVDFTKMSTSPLSVKIPDISMPPSDDDLPYFLKNGKVGQEYLEKIDFKRIYNKREISDYTVEGLESLGLKLDNETGKISGIPIKAGNPKENFEYELTVRYQLSDGDKESKKIFIKIVPDPRSMWKSLEPPDELGDRKAHTDHCIMKLGKDKNSNERILVSASKRGRSHAHKALFRDDHMDINYIDDLGWSIIAVADGAGSAKLSRIGSKIACEIAVKHITDKIKAHNDELEEKIKDTTNNNDSNSKGNKLKLLLYEIVAAAAFQAAKALQEEAKTRQVLLKDFSTTLLLGLHKKFEFGSFFSGFWIGDGALAIYNKEARTVKLLGVPDGGEFSGETKFITMNMMMTPEELTKRIHYEVVDDFTAFFAMTDGVSDPKFPTESNLGTISFWDGLWNELENEVISSENNLDVKLLEWLDFWVEGEHDDRTIAVLF